MRNPIAARLRQVVSADRMRYTDATTGADMDLSYITSNIIAMGFPASGLEAAWRNHIDDVAKFLKTAHNSCFMIWNLSEREYDYGKFDNNIMDFGFPDHHSPPLDMLFKIIQNMDNWLRASKDNVAVVHCFPEEDMQVLTNEGFMFLRDVEQHFDSTTRLQKPESTLRFAAYNSDSKTISYERSARLIVRELTQDEQLVEMGAKDWQKNGGLSVVATAGHDMWVREGTLNGEEQFVPSSNFQKVKAGRLLEKRNNDNGAAAQFCARAAGGFVPVDHFDLNKQLQMDLSMEQQGAVFSLFGLWLASEGSHTASWLSFGCSRRAADCVANWLSALNLSWSFNGTDSDVVSVSVNCTGFEPLFSESNVAWVLRLDRRCAQAVLEGMTVGLRGEDNSLVVHSAKLRDLCIRLALHAGLSASSTSQRSGHFQVRIRHGAAAADPVVKEVVAASRPSSGRVWCVSVPSGLICVRRAVSAQTEKSALADAHTSLPVVCGNCMGGKGRTGTVIACYLLYCGLFRDPREALNYFAERRSRISKGVIQPSQLRYVNYFAKILEQRKMPGVRDVMIQKIILHGVPKFSKNRQGCKPILKVYNVSQLPKRLLFASGDPRDESLFIDVDKGGVTWKPECVTRGDVMIKCKHYGEKKKMTIFKTTFHTAFTQSVERLDLKSLDATLKPKKQRRPDTYPDDFCVAIYFEELDTMGAADYGDESHSPPHKQPSSPRKLTTKATGNGAAASSSSAVPDASIKPCMRCLLYNQKDAPACVYCRMIFE